MINGEHGQSWRQQKKVCRPAQPLRLGDDFHYYKSDTHSDPELFRSRMQVRAFRLRQSPEARNAQQ